MIQSNALGVTAISIGEIDFSWQQVVAVVIVTIIGILIYRFSRRRIKKYADLHDLTSTHLNSITILTNTTIFFLWVLGMIFFLGFNYSFVDFGSFSVTLTGLLGILCLILLAKIADAFLSARIIEEMHHRLDTEFLQSQYGIKEQRSNITKIIQYCLITLVLIAALPILGLDFNFHTFHLRDREIDLMLTKVLSAFLVILLARIIMWMLINLFLYGWYQRNQIDLGKQYAYNQLISYVLYLFAVIIAMQYLGLDFTLLWAGAAALLVGIGIALQQVISDFFSGLVILFERSVEVGDFLDFGNYRGTVKKIGLRASIIETLERKDVILPNSKLVNESVINWTRTRKVTRFEVIVGAAYGSDTKLVKSTLLEAVQGVKGVLYEPKPFVRFINFGDSSLDFSLLFFSEEVMSIEDVKSDIRFAVDAAFRASGIAIPFPQRDVWIKTSNK